MTRVNRNGVIRSYSFGTSFFVQTKTHPETGITRYTYDAVGNMKTKRVGSSPITNFSYDDLNRLELINYPGNTPDTERTWDKNSQLRRVESGITDIRYAYDKNQNLRTEEHIIDGESYFHNYSYDSRDFLESVTNPDNSVIEYDPNNLGWPTQAAPFVTRVQYNASGQPTLIEYDNGRKLTHSYDNRLWPDVTRVDGNISNRERTYDKSGNMTRLDDKQDNRFDRNLTFDRLHRLKTASGPWGNGTVTYSTSDDIIRKDMGNNDLIYSYNNSTRRINSIIGIQDISSSVFYDYDYDHYGNVIKKANNNAGWHYTYDDASNLRQVRDYEDVVLRDYDYSGLRQRVRSIKSDETRIHIVTQGGQIVYENVTSGGKPNITNVYLGNRLVAELEAANDGPPEDVDGPGFGGDDDEPTVVSRTFILEEGFQTVEYCVNGFGVSNATEVQVSINGTDIGFLRPGFNGIQTCFDIDPSLLRVGSNTISFTSLSPEDVWGVGDFDITITEVFMPAAVVPAINLLLNEEDQQEAQ